MQFLFGSVPGFSKDYNILPRRELHRRVCVGKFAQIDQEASSICGGSEYLKSDSHD